MSVEPQNLSHALGYIQFKSTTVDRKRLAIKTPCPLLPAELAALSLPTHLPTVSVSHPATRTNNVKNQKKKNWLSLTI